MVPFREDSEIEEMAEAFLRKHNGMNDIPVPIESIIELDLGIDIVPERDLESRYSIGAFISRDGTEIRVDLKTYLHQLERYRFSLAHEIGHVVLGHVEIANQYDPSSFWGGTQTNLPSIFADRMEVQANKFAGMVLMPKEEVIRRYVEIVLHLTDRDERERHDIATRHLAKSYEVNWQVAHIRLRDLNLKDK